MRFRITKEYDVAPEVVEEIADAMLEWMDSKGWHMKWNAAAGPEQKAADGDEMSYRDMAAMFVLETGTE